jgi:hypothetical protein
MQLLRPSPSNVPYGLRAMKMIALAGASGVVTPAVANMLGGAQRVLLATDIPLEPLPPIEAPELARAFAGEGADGGRALATQLVQGMLMVSLADGPPTRAQMALIDGFAEALGVEGPELRTMRLLADEHMLFFRLHFLRHSHIGRLAAQGIREHGLLAPLHGFLMMRGLAEDRALAERYHALASLPEGTLGRAFLAYIEANHFSVPGDKGGFPEIGIWHDFGHVLTGYHTDPEGELQMAAFQAGYMKTKPIFMLLFAAITFSAGINVTPLPQSHDHGIFARPGLMERVLHALERGSKVNVDLSDHWDHWQWVDKPVEEVRAALGLAA